MSTYASPQSDFTEAYRACYLALEWDSQLRSVRLTFRSRAGNGTGIRAWAGLATEILAGQTWTSKANKVGARVSSATKHSSCRLAVTHSKTAFQKLKILRSRRLFHSSAYHYPTGM